MGRNKTYATAADRQRAYRERKKPAPADALTPLERELLVHVERYALYWYDSVCRHYRTSKTPLDFQLVFNKYGAGKGIQDADILMNGKYWQRLESAGALYLLRTGRLLLTTRRHWSDDVYVFRDAFNVTRYTLRNEVLS